MVELIYKEECYKIVGLCFEVYNRLGPGLREAYYQKALEELLKSNQIDFTSQLFVPIKINGKTVGKYYLDFLIEDKIVLELKVGELFRRKDITQLLSYLKSKGIKLGVIINFTNAGVSYKRILNIKD